MLPNHHDLYTSTAVQRSQVTTETDARLMPDPRFPHKCPARARGSAAEHSHAKMYHGFQVVSDGGECVGNARSN
jgi:hypothetical protein